MTPRVKESEIVAQIRNTLKALRIPHWKNWGGPLGERGVPDIIGVLPGSGRLLLVEVKTASGTVSPIQQAFLEKYAAAGALALVARDPMEVVRALKAAGYSPAGQITGMFEGRQGTSGVYPNRTETGLGGVFKSETGSGIPEAF